MRRKLHVFHPFYQLNSFVLASARNVTSSLRHIPTVHCMYLGEGGSLKCLVFVNMVTYNNNNLLCKLQNPVTVQPGEQPVAKKPKIGKLN